jgi:hypothetical protein
VVGHSGITHRAQVNGIKRTQLFEAIFWHHAARLEVVLATPVEVLPREGQIEAASHGLEHADALGNDLVSNPVSFNYGDPIVLQTSLAVILFVGTTCCKAPLAYEHPAGLRACAPVQ